MLGGCKLVRWDESQDRGKEADDSKAVNESVVVVVVMKGGVVVEGADRVETRSSLPPLPNSQAFDRDRYQSPIAECVRAGEDCKSS
jgi:hypothetical protein